MSDVKETKKEIIDIEKILQDNIEDVSVEGNTATIKFKDGTFNSTLPEHLTEKTVKESVKHIKDTAAALASVTSKVSLEHKNGFKNKDVNEVNSLIPISKGTSVEARTDREKQVATSAPGEDRTSGSKHAQTVAKISLSNPKTHVKEVNQSAHEQFEKAFGKKK